MDPVQTYQDWLESVCDDEKAYHAENLIGWIQKGGFNPLTTEQKITFSQWCVENM